VMDFGARGTGAVSFVVDCATEKVVAKHTSSRMHPQRQFFAVTGSPTIQFLTR
jgi:hypothetical protein